METRSLIKYLRISPKKIKSLSHLTVGLSPDKAVDRLMFMSGKASVLLSASIKSAKANAVNNLKLNPDKLIIKKIITGKGPIFKRWQPVARGGAHQIKKRTTHLTVELAEKETPRGKPALETEKKEVKKDVKEVK